LAYLVFQKRNVKFRQSRALQKSEARAFKRILPFNLPTHDSKVIEVAGLAGTHFSVRHAFKNLAKIFRKIFTRRSPLTIDRDGRDSRCCQSQPATPSCFTKL
jgi:hypothetical protein